MLEKTLILIFSHQHFSCRNHSGEINNAALLTLGSICSRLTVNCFYKYSWTTGWLPQREKVSVEQKDSSDPFWLWNWNKWLNRKSVKCCAFLLAFLCWESGKSTDSNPQTTALLEKSLAWHMVSLPPFTRAKISKHFLTTFLKEKNQKVFPQ